MFAPLSPGKFDYEAYRARIGLLFRSCTNTKGEKGFEIDSYEKYYLIMMRFICPLSFMMFGIKPDEKLNQEVYLSCAGSTYLLILYA